MKFPILAETMADRNWKEIEELGKQNTPVLFPIGVIEEHGPHLPLATDILWSLTVCQKIKEAMEKQGHPCLIAPPYYWGVNHCTGSFPGSFSLKPETMKLVLLDIFENLHQFGFDRVYCANYHGDPLHVSALLDSIQAANQTFNMKIRLLMEGYDLAPLGLTGEEDYILVDRAEFPPECFAGSEGEPGLYDIHAGAFETAVMNTFYPGSVGKNLVQDLPSYSLTEEGLSQWMAGGEASKQVVPLGYAGNPAGYENYTHLETLFAILTGYYAQEIIKDA